MRRLFAFLVTTILATAQVPTPEQALSFRSFSDAHLSPDASLAAFAEQTTNWKENEFQTQIWIARTATGERFQLTRGAKSASAPRWSPDGKLLAFAREHDGKRQIWLIAPQGGEAWPLTADEGGVQSFEWAPDSKSLVYTSNGAEPKDLKDRKDKFGDFIIDGLDHRFTHLHLAPLPESPGTIAKSEPLTSGNSFTVSGFAIAPDGASIAFTAGRDPDLNSSHTIDLYLLALSDKSVKPLVTTPGPESNPVWSPDSRQIAFQTANSEPYFYFKNTKVAVIPASGGTPRLIAADFDENPRLLDWAPSGLFFQAQQRTHVWLFQANPASGQWRRVLGDDSFSLPGVSFSADFRHALVTGARPNDFLELYVTETARLKPRPLTDYRSQFKDFQLANQELIRWKSKDGAEIEGVLTKPANYDPSRKYPLLFVIHGGPTGTDRPWRAPDRYYPIERFADKGALILRPNYRGSAGYGEAFRSLNVRNLGVGDAWDVVSAIDHLNQLGLIDPTRVGTMGWSQGGYISAFLTTAESPRFKAASVGAGISNWMTYYVNTDIHPFTRMYLKSTPWDDPEIYAKTSPMTHIKQAQTPTLIQHGQNDARVPLPNAYELHQGLQDQKTESRLVVYPGFGHGITKPKQLLHVMQDNESWFLKHIWGEETSPQNPLPSAAKP
jgi:dipeptidyl aminopeptidase/acylaminoacyl peptidase